MCYEAVHVPSCTYTWNMDMDAVDMEAVDVWIYSFVTLSPPAPPILCPQPQNTEHNSRGETTQNTTQGAT